MNEANQTLTQYERLYGPFVHMSQSEKAIWLRWLIAGGHRWEPFYYDTRVGAGLTMPLGSSGYDIRSAAALTTKRIDVMFMANNEPIIVEVKVRAGLSAIGQLIGYKDLFLLSQEIYKTCQMLLITDGLQPDMPTLLTRNNIKFQIV